VTVVKKFADRKKAVARIRTELQKLGGPETPQDAHVAPEEAPAKKKASRAKKSRTEPTAAKGPREGSKTETILGLLRQKGGSTLKALMEATAWQAHSVRGFISAVVTKKMAFTIESTRNEEGERTYSVKA
jgi:hypothetical protein